MCIHAVHALSYNYLAVEAILNKFALQLVLNSIRWMYVEIQLQAHAQQISYKLYMAMVCMDEARQLEGIALV